MKAILIFYCVSVWGPRVGDHLMIAIGAATAGELPGELDAKLSSITQLSLPPDTI